MTTTRAQIHSQTETILSQQQTRETRVSTASERAAQEQTLDQLAKAHSILPANVLGAADDLQAEREEHEVSQEQGLRSLLDTLTTTNIATTVVRDTQKNMRDCAVISEAAALEEARHGSAVAADREETAVRMQDLLTGLEAESEELTNEAAEHANTLAAGKTQRDQEMAVSLDLFTYALDRERAVQEKDAIDRAKRTAQEISKAGEPVLAELAKRQKNLSAQEDEVEAASVIIENLDTEVCEATNTARSNTIRDTHKEGAEVAAVATIEWEGELSRLEKQRETLSSELADFSAREENLVVELATATAALKALHTEAVGG